MSASFVSPSVRMDGIASTRSRLSKAGHAPGAIYCSEDIFQREIATCFMKDWLCVGRVEEVAKPGDYMTMRIAGEPVVITRASDNNLHALYNMCAHRGVEVAHGRGNARVFNCPYHGWTYDLEGKLKGAAYMKESEGFDLSACRLQPIRIDVWRGSIFICFSAETEPFEEFIRPFEDDFAFLHPERCRIGYKLHLEVNCNWKFITENIMDFYHVKVLHAGTFGARFSWKEEDVILKEHGGYTLFYKAGPHTPGAEPLLGKMPWLADQDLESVRRLYVGLQSFRSMSRMDASLMKASALRLRFSQSLASRRQRLSQAMVRSTTQRLGWTTKPFTRSDRLTISVSRSGRMPARAR